MGENKASKPHLPLIFFGIALLCWIVGYTVGVILLGGGLTIHEEVFQVWMLISMFIFPLGLSFVGIIVGVLDIFRNGIRIKTIMAFMLNTCIFVGLVFLEFRGHLT